MGFPCGLIEDIVIGIEVFDDVFLVVERFDDVLPGINLFDLPVDMAQIFLLRLEVFLGMLDNDGNQKCRDRQHHNSDEGHERADGQHHDENADDGGDGKMCIRDRW